jgi:TolA-binding protein
MMTFRATAIGIAKAIGTASVAGLAMTVMFATTASAQQLDPPIDAQVSANNAGAESQKRVEDIASATDTLIAEFRLTNKKIESLQIFNRQLRQVIDSQHEELDSLQLQIDGVEEVGRAVTPLMLKMIEALDQFVKFDVPFLIDERIERVAGLRVLMRMSDVAEPERYRRILEAYQIENDYGRTIDAHSGTIDKDGLEVPVDFLRIGRIGLLYKTRDAEGYGVWNQGDRVWNMLDKADYSNAIDEGLRVAKKQAAPQLIRIPLPQPVAGGNS